MSLATSTQEEHSKFQPLLPNLSKQDSGLGEISNNHDQRRSLDLQHGTSYPSQSLRFLGHSPINAFEDDVQTSRLPLRIVIVGAGLGGLATAIALARRGHSVVVLEKATKLGEVGAGIQIPPNSGLVLKRWGVLELFESKAVRPASINFRRWSNGAKIGYTDLREFEEGFGVPYYVCHRAHLHEALHARAVQLGVEIRLGCRALRYHASEGIVELVDNSRIQGDLVVAADGVKSIARQALGLPEGKLHRTGFAAYRATVDVDKMREHPELHWLLEKPSLNIWIGEDRHVMTYMISGGNSFNMVLSHVDKSDPAIWKQEAALSDMQNEFANWDPQLTKVISLIKTCLKWPLSHGSKLQSWLHESSKFVILGDAAHAMVPYMSQGAAMAVEDGAALAVALNDIANLDELPRSLRLFEAERLERSSAMQDASMVNGVIWHFPDGPEQEARDAGMKAEVDGRPFTWSSNQWSDPVTQWWAYGYDAEKAILHRMELNGP